MESIPIAADHAGFALKQKLVARLAALGYDVQDLGTVHAAVDAVLVLDDRDVATVQQLCCAALAEAVAGNQFADDPVELEPFGTLHRPHDDRACPREVIDSRREGSRECGKPALGGGICAQESEAHGYFSPRWDPP